MSTEVRDNPEASRFELLVDGRLAGFAQYRLNDERITMYHTEVEPEYEERDSVTSSRAPRWMTSDAGALCWCPSARS